MANNDGKTGFLNEGSTVEVRIEGAWYQADIVTLCAKSKDQFRVLRRRSHLVEDLVEIRISSIRPLPPPPPADQSYEPRDVVDVFVDYGWWKGVVSGVYTFKGEAIYTVFLFENPPYFQDRVFKCEEIRFHWVWTYDGRWVRPPKPQEIPGIGEECSTLEQSNPVTATSMGKKLNTPTPETMANNDNQIGFLSEGSEVEVAIEGVWYASDIVTQCPKSKDQFRVLCRRRYFEENLLNVNISSIRPRPPPPAADQSYEPRDVVDVLHRYGWWKGVVSEVHILKGQTRYTVVLFGNLPHFEDKIFTSEEMRFHWVWTHDSKWVRLPKSTEIPGLGEKSLRLEQLIPVTGTSTGKSPNAPATESMVDSENQIGFLSEGSTVEVKNEGAWYEADIITQCAKSKDRFCVLFRDRRSWYKHKMLNFHISSIRPHPPPPAAEQSYEPLDVVDAFVCHGWWKGVVTEVDTLEGKTNATKLYSDPL